MILIGAGYRLPIHTPIVEHLSAFDTLEVMVDHYLDIDEPRRARIRALADGVPLGAHGLGLSLGTAALPDSRYLDAVAGALSAFRARYYSEHVAFTRADGVQFDELLPVPCTAEAAEHLIRNIARVRSTIDVPFYLENIAGYFTYPDAELGEAELFNLLCRETGAGVLLDVENLYANQVNHGTDGGAFIDALAPGSVKALHIAGGSWRGDVFVDDHGHTPPDGAMQLMDHALRCHAPEIIIVERDKNLGDGRALLADVARVRGRAAHVARSKVRVEPRMCDDALAG